jgi:hypothetical protein
MVRTDSYKDLVMVLPDGTEIHYSGYCPNGSNVNWSSLDYSSKCRDAVYSAKLTTPRKNPTQVVVQVFELKLKEGKVEKRSVGTWDVTPPLERLTGSEYKQEMEDLLSKIPEEFHSFVKEMCYDRSDSFEERINMAEDMTNALEECFHKYRISNQ